VTSSNAAFQRGVKVAWAGVEQGEAAHPAGVVLGEAEGEEAPVVVARQVHRRAVERVQQPAQPGDLRGVVEAQAQRYDEALAAPW
jgi:hypothetical protein